MPVSAVPGLVVTTASVVGTVLVALALVGLTRLIVRFAAEPDRVVRHRDPARGQRRPERDR